MKGYLIQIARTTDIFSCVKPVTKPIRQQDRYLLKAPLFFHSKTNEHEKVLNNTFIYRTNNK